MLVRFVPNDEHYVCRNFVGGLKLNKIVEEVFKLGKIRLG
jgi:hypothetical protein